MKWTRTESGIPSEIGIPVFLAFAIVSAYYGYTLLTVFGTLAFLQFLTGRFQHNQASAFFWFTGFGVGISMILTYSALHLNLVLSLVVGQASLWTCASIGIWWSKKNDRRVSEAMKEMFKD
jgi:hypothetical protein